MKLYYHAISAEGKAVRGLIDAKDEKDVAHYLRNQNLTPVKIMPAAKRGFRRFIPTRGPKLAERIFFTRQLSSMLTSGLTLMQGLVIIKNQTPNPVMAGVVQDVMTGVEGGKIFSSCLEKYPDLFPPIYVSLIRTAESSGLLDKVLLRLADNLEKQDKLQKTIKSALTYPIIVITIMILVMMIMMIFVMPQLSSLYISLNVALPLSTKIVLGLSSIVSKIWYLIIGGMFGLVYGVRRWYKKESGKRFIDAILLKLPVFGKLITQTIMAEFTGTLGILIGSGSLVVDSLIKTSDIVGNIYYRDAIILISKRVEKGITMGNAMDATSLFPPMVVEMVKIGEQTGKLEDSLIRSSEYFEREVNQTVKNLTTLMEPYIIVILGAGVGFLIFSIITPIYSLISSIK